MNPNTSVTICGPADSPARCLAFALGESLKQQGAFPFEEILVIDQLFARGSNPRLEQPEVSCLLAGQDSKTRAAIILAWERGANNSELSDVPVIFVIPTTSLKSIATELQRVPVPKRSVPHKPLTREDCERLLCLSLGTDSFAKLIQSVGDAYKGLFENKDGWPDFYYCLLAATASMAQFRHDVVKPLSRPILEDDGRLSRAIRQRSLIEAMDGLKLSLTHRLNPPLPGCPKVMLFVDDNLGEFNLILAALGEMLLPDYQLWWWNPLDDAPHEGRGELLAISYLRDYCSLSPHSELEAIKFRVRKIGSQTEASGPPETADWTFADIPKECRFVVVDQLFKGQLEWGGAEIIEGLSRLFNDRCRKEAHFQPQIVALSRDENPQVIQRALNAGARSYVYKSNLLRLPAILAGLQDLGEVEPEYLQRNFLSLNRLPNRVRRLIHRVPVPPLPDAVGSTDIEKLLGAIPKAELHVHVGSRMQPEFLILASFIGLLISCKTPQTWWLKFLAWLKKTDTGTSEVAVKTALGELHLNPGPDWISSMRREVRIAIQRFVEKWYDPTSATLVIKTEEERREYSSLRSLLHKELDLLDYLPPSEIVPRFDKHISDLKVCLFGMRYDQNLSPKQKEEAFVRLYLLYLASKGGSILESNENIHDNLLKNFSGEVKEDDEPFKKLEACWEEIRERFVKGGFCVDRLRREGWYLNGPCSMLGLRLKYQTTDSSEKESHTPSRSSIEWLLATGARASNLAEYLRGCDFSGAVHLRHPFLIHLYAQHIMRAFVDEGIAYAELRGSPDGYANDDIRFSFADACECFRAAVQQAEELTLFAHRKAALARLQGLPPNPDVEKKGMWLPDLLFEFGLNGKWSYMALCRAFLSDSILDRRLPPKVNLLLVGKRHKTNREMILEAAASAVMHSGDANRRPNWYEEIRRCDIVGFDLAGNEPDFPPRLYSGEFQRLAKLHVPMTVHAGENAGAAYIEDAVLELGASRIGHGLSATDDKRLLARMREDRICVELCPVSNHQTSHFVGADKEGREYPLKELLETGVPVCLSTDNPVISDTTLIKEYRKASAAYGELGMTLWTALLLVKMGFRHAFLPLQIRRSILELVDQILFDLFSDKKVIDVLERLVELHRFRSPGSRPDSSQPED
jgi:adenosine deaminase